MVIGLPLTGAIAAAQTWCTTAGNISDTGAHRALRLQRSDGI